MPSDTFLATFGLIGLRLLERNSVDTRRFVAELGIDTSVPAEARTRLPSQLIDRGFARAVALIDDPAFALGAAACWHPSDLGTLGYAWLSSDTLRTGLKRLVRYSRTLGTKGACHCHDERDGLRFVFEHRRGDNAVGHVIADFWLALALAMCRTNYGQQLCPQTVSLRRPPPADDRPYHEFFGCTVNFCASEDSLVLASDIADAPLPTSNRALAQTFDAILARQLSELDHADLAARCQEHLMQQLTSGEPSESDLAAALAMSRRTLQRRLAALGLSYQQLLDQTRRTLALRYLAEADRSVTEIAFLLGFSEQSAFSRAFRRWNGQSPGAYRRAHLATPGSAR